MQQRYWGGDLLPQIGVSDVLVFGSNPQGRHGKGLALEAKNRFGAITGKGRGLSGRSYALPTKNLKTGFVEAETGIKYRSYGGISIYNISKNIDELYVCATRYPDRDFYVPYTMEGENLNGYTGAAMRKRFVSEKVVPPNIIFHHSFK